MEQLLAVTPGWVCLSFILYKKRFDVSTLLFLSNLLLQFSCWLPGPWAITSSPWLLVLSLQPTVPGVSVRALG